MTAAQHPHSIAPLLTGAATCAAAATLLTGTTALGVALTGVSDTLRHALAFSFGGVPHTPVEAGRILAQNGRLAAGILFCTAVRPCLPAAACTTTDVLLAALLTLNAVAVGLALGVYGRHLVTTTVLHAVPEFAALSLAGGAYMSTRKQAISGALLAATAALCALLLTGAALLETYASTGAQR
jgi:hypothetical protein